MNVVVINSNHLLYDKHSLTFVGTGADPNRTAMPVSGLKVVGLSNVLDFLLLETTPLCDIYSYLDEYTLELYPNMDAMATRWRELRGVV